MSVRQSGPRTSAIWQGATGPRSSGRARASQHPCRSMGRVVQDQYHSWVHGSDFLEGGQDSARRSGPGRDLRCPRYAATPGRLSSRYVRSGARRHHAGRLSGFGEAASCPSAPCRGRSTWPSPLSMGRWNLCAAAPEARSTPCRHMPHMLADALFLGNARWHVYLITADG